MGTSRRTSRTGSYRAGAIASLAAERPSAFSMRVWCDYGLVSTNTAMLRSLARAELVSTMPLPVLISGEPGSGKTSIAEAIHTLSRAQGSCRFLAPWILGPSDIRALTFGLRGGSTSRYPNDVPGILSLAEEGTVILADIDHFPAPLQVAIAGYIEYGLYRPVGRTSAERGRARIIMTMCSDPVTSRTLVPEIARSRAWVPIHVPPLRERPEDFRFLIAHLWPDREKSPWAYFTDEILYRLKRLRWENENVAGLRTLVQRVHIMSEYLGLVEIHRRLHEWIDHEEEA